MIGNQIGVSKPLDPIKVDKIAELIWESKLEVYQKFGKTKKSWNELSIHERNIYKETAERFLKFYSKYF